MYIECLVDPYLLLDKAYGLYAFKLCAKVAETAAPSSLCDDCTARASTASVVRS